MRRAFSDYFERARAWSATGMFMAAALTVAGSLLDWVTVRQSPPEVPADQLDRAPPLSGIDVGDGWITLIAGVILAGAAVLLILRARSSFAWLGFVSAVTIGGIAISDYRGINSLFEQVQGIGRGPRPGIGLTIVAFGGLLGLISSVAAIAATPSASSAPREESEPTSLH